MRERMGGMGAVLDEQIERAHRACGSARAAILVEGVSDQLAVERLARRRGRDLDADAVAVIPVAGATNIGRFLDILGPGGGGLRLAGLYDEAEESVFAAAVVRAGLTSGVDRGALADAGFFVCVRDLEEELIRALGPHAVLEIIESQGHRRRFRTFQSQAVHRDEPLADQLRRWLGNHKIRYAPLMVQALAADGVPVQLDAVLSHL